MSHLLPPVEQVQKVKRSRIFGVVAYVGLGFCLAVISMLIFWGVYPYDVLQIKNAPLPVSPQQVRAAQFVFLETNFCKLTNHKGTVNTILVLGAKEVLLPVYPETTKRRCEKTEIPVRIPRELEKGEAYIRFVVEYHVNPIRTVTEVFASQEFEILP